MVMEKWRYLGTGLMDFGPKTRFEKLIRFYWDISNTQTWFEYKILAIGGSKVDQGRIFSDAEVVMEKWRYLGTRLMDFDSKTGFGKLIIFYWNSRNTEIWFEYKVLVNGGPKVYRGWLPMKISIYLSIYLSIYPSIYYFVSNQYNFNNSLTHKVFHTTYLIFAKHTQSSQSQITIKASMAITP
jgi:hypothetical protein